MLTYLQMRHDMHRCWQVTQPVMTNIQTYQAAQLGNLWWQEIDGIRSNFKDRQILQGPRVCC